MNTLHKRILEISKKHGLSHLGSNLTAVNIIDHIYSIKSAENPFILSCGHAGLALYVVLEKYHGLNAETLYLKHGTHPNRNIHDKIFCSTGSLGQGLPIALGAAMADRNKNVYCLISDGEATEGTIWETANVIIKYRVENLKIFVNFNGWGAYDPIYPQFITRLKSIFPLGIRVIDTRVEDHGLTGQSAHYVKAE